jgi:ATP-binding cassette subfamily B protein RaxB
MTDFLLQHTASECGLACIGSALNHFGSKVSLADLREKFPVGTRGMRLDELVFIAGASGLVTTAIKLDLKEITQLRLPAVLHWDMDHYVLLIKANSRQVTIHDPASGTRKIPVEEAGRHFTGVALELAKSATFTPIKPKNPVTLRKLLGSVSGIRRTVVVLSALACGAQLASMVAPLVMQWIIDQALVAGDKDLLWLLIAGYVGLNMFQQIFTYGRGIAALTFSNQVGYQWSSNVMLHLLHLPVSWFEKRHPVTSCRGSRVSVRFNKPQSQGLSKRWLTVSSRRWRSE